MDEHHCLLCMGSNTNRYAQLSVAREALRATFPDIHFGEMMETEAVGSGFHSPFSNQLAKFSTTLSPDSVHDLFKGKRIYPPWNVCAFLEFIPFIY